MKRNKCTIKHPIGKKGQGLIEAILVTPLFFGSLFFSFLLIIKYLSFYIVDDQLYQALLCLKGSYHQNYCEKNLEKNVQLFLPFLTIKKISIKKLNNQISGETTFNLAKLWQQNIKKKLQLPKLNETNGDTFK